MSARITLVVLCLAATSAWAAVPGRIHVNGALSDSDDRPIDGERSVSFNLYSQAEGGEAFFTETLAVLFHKGTFFAELGGTKTLDLDLLVASKDSVWLGVAVGEGEELSPRLRMGSVPLAAYAHRAGSAAVADLATEATHAASATRADSAAKADVATTAETLAGAGANAYRKTADPVPFSDLVGVPPGLGDGDNDLFATLVCAAGHAAIFDGTQWNCALPFASKRCQPGMVVTGVDSFGNLECAVDKDTDTDTDTKYTGANFALSNKACPSGEVLRGINASGEPLCVADKDTDTKYTAKALGGLDIAGSVISLLQNCGAGQMLKSDGAGNWSCQPDTDTTYTGATFTKSNQDCPDGAVMTGIDENGIVKCTTTTFMRDYVNANCRLYVGWQDTCSNCSSVTNWVRVGGNEECSAQNGCLTTALTGSEPLVDAGQTLWKGRLRMAGDVNADDTFFYAFRCR